MKATIACLLTTACLPYLYGAEERSSRLIAYDPKIERQREVKALTDEDAIAEYAKNDPDLHVRWVAVEKLTDQTLLADIAKNCEYPDARQKAVMKLEDLTIVASIAKNDTDEETRQKAVYRLECQPLLEELANNDELFGKQHTAKYQLDEKILFMVLAKHSKEEQTRLWAAQKLNYQPLLLDFATNVVYHSNVRQSATAHLSDKALIMNLANNDKDEGVRVAANQRLDVLNKKDSDDKIEQEKPVLPQHEVDR
jgi:hypothetical protein